MERIKPSEKGYLMKQLDEVEIKVCVEAEVELRQRISGVLEKVFRNERIILSREEKRDYLQLFENKLKGEGKTINGRDFVREYVSFIELELKKELEELMNRVRKVVDYCFKEGKKGSIVIGDTFIRIDEYSMLRIKKEKVLVELN